MDAWVIREERHGEPEQALRLETVAVPRPREGEVLVRVMAAGINYNGGVDLPRPTRAAVPAPDRARLSHHG